MNFANKKRPMALVLFIIALIIALAACGNSGSDKGAGDTKADAASGFETGGNAGGEAYALYKSAADAMNQADGYEMDMQASMSMDANEQKSDTTTKDHIVMNDPSGKMEMKITSTTEGQGQKLEIVSYLKDDFLYTEIFDQKVKTPMNVSQLNSYANRAVDFAENAIIDENITDVDGGKQVSFTIKGEALSDIIKAQAGLSNVTQTLEDINFKFENVKITAIIGADGNLLESTTEATFSLESSIQGNATDDAMQGAEGSSGLAISATMKNVMSNIKIGKTTIDFPTDLDAYTEAGLDALPQDAE
jgi:hypothetical protein